MPCNLFVHPCWYVERACVNGVCILSSCKRLFSALSAFSLHGIPVYAGIQLIVGLCVNLDAASLMALVVVCKCCFPVSCMFTADNNYVCIVIVSLVPPASSSSMRMAVILGERPMCLF